jgi:methionine-rich copper-binding protein CopC
MMRVNSMFVGAVLALATFGAAGVASAHTKVVASTPVQGATVSSTKVITLTFSEALLPPTVATAIVMTAMPGMANHGEMTIRNFQSAWSNENRTLTMTLKQPLRAGSYDVRWQAAGADGHRMTGTVSFTVS